MFCLQCGQSLVQPGVRKRPVAVWVAIALAGVLALGALLTASGALKVFGESKPNWALRAEGSQSGDTLRAEGSSQGGLLRADGQSSDPVLDVTGERKLMPADVRAWLEHLERIERKRGQLAMEQLSEAIITLSELQLGGSIDALQSLLGGDEGTEAPSPATEAKRDFDAYKGKWRQLEDEFASVRPPGECGPIRDAYNVALGETGNMILEIVDQIQNAEQDRAAALRALNAMKGTSDDRIGHPSNRTDALVADICRKYDTAKWFDIKNDFGSGMFGKLGF